MEQVTLGDIQRMTESGEIMGFVTKDETRYNTFINSFGKVSYYTGKNSRRSSTPKGMTLDERHLKEFKRFIKERVNETERVKFRLINKLGKMMLESADNNSITKPLREVPNTYKEWMDGGQKSLKMLGFGDGTDVVGTVIKVDSLLEDFGGIVSEFLNCYYSGQHFQSTNFQFRGFSTHLIVWIEENGGVVGELVRVYKNGTIIKYILINRAFVGYSKTLGY